MASKKRFCFVTEADLDRQGVGGVVTDQQMLQCLKEFGKVDVIYLKRIRYRSTPLALMIFFFQILKSFSKPYNVYFSRGLITSVLLFSFNTLTLKRRKIVHRALSVPLGSEEVKFLKYGRVQSFVRFSLFQFLERVLLMRLDVITVASDEYGDVLVHVGVDRNRIHVVPFYVENEFFNQPLKKDVSKPFVFGYAGGFHLYHDLSPLIEAFELFVKNGTSAQLVFVGDGLSRLQIEREVKRRRLVGKVRFLGMVPHASMPKLLAQMDCFILLTRAHGLPIGLLEAAAAGKPIITVKKETDITLEHYFRTGKEIYLLNSISLDEITKAMKLLYEASHLRNAVAQGARKVAQQNFSEKATLQQLQKLIQKIS